MEAERDAKEVSRDALGEKGAQAAVKASNEEPIDVGITAVTAEAIVQTRIAWATEVGVDRRLQSSSTPLLPVLNQPTLWLGPLLLVSVQLHRTPLHQTRPFLIRQCADSWKTMPIWKTSALLLRTISEMHLHRLQQKQTHSRRRRHLHDPHHLFPPPQFSRTRRQLSAANSPPHPSGRSRSFGPQQRLLPQRQRLQPTLLTPQGRRRRRGAARRCDGTGGVARTGRTEWRPSGWWRTS